MRNRKELKKQARTVVKHHYVLLVALCLIATYFGIEFASEASLLEIYPTDSETEIALNNNLPSTYSSGKVLENIIMDNIEGSELEASSIVQNLKENQSSAIVGRSRGVLAKAVNNLQAGRGYIAIANILHQIIKNGTVATAVFILLVYGAWSFIYVFVLGIFRTIMRRAFLEARTYQKVPLSHLIYYNNAGEWVRSALGLLLMDVYYMLWSLTIVGAFIKFFSYLMVPYILAENPNMKARDAVTLSRRMMDGHKWEACKLYLSFIGWYLLGIVTFGLSDYFYFLPYQTATFSEYYADLRLEAQARNIPGIEALDDTYLFLHSNEVLLRKTYQREYEEMQALDGEKVEITGLQKFFAENFALWIGSIGKKRKYQDYISKQNHLKTVREVVEGKVYPRKCNPRQEVGSRTKLFSQRTHYLRCYTIWSILTIFIVLAFVGWLWEVGLHVVNDGVFVNRGALHGPWLPIYGAGAVAIMILLARFRSNPPLIFILAMVVSGVLEFFGSYFMELKYGIRWWDYTGYFLNLNGRICAEGLLVFAVGGLLIVYLVAPMLDGLLSRIKPKHLIPVILAIYLVFAVDLVYSNAHPNEGEGITSYDAYKTVQSNE